MLFQTANRSETIQEYQEYQKFHNFFVDILSFALVTDT